MPLYVSKWNIHPDKVEAYNEWTRKAIRKTVGAPGVVEFRGYRVAAGSHQVVTTYEFADLTALGTWLSNPDVDEMRAELRTLANDVTDEIWGPSQIVPAPVRPK